MAQLTLAVSPADPFSLHIVAMLQETADHSIKKLAAASADARVFPVVRAAARAEARHAVAVPFRILAAERAADEEDEYRRRSTSQNL
jgi:hypothetical protein